jgi:outer membrane lipoprotein carrier protein
MLQGSAVRHLIGILALLLLVSGTAPASADALKDALARLQARYETTRTLAADFRQTIESPTLATPLESKGTVAFEKPNRMRWEYEAPDHQLIVGDGTILWIYQPEDKQAIKAPLGEMFQATTPVSFLAGLGHLDRDFNATLEREEKERWVLRLMPKTEKSIGTLVLVVRKSDAGVDEARVTDSLGTTTKLVLSGEKRNVDLDPKLFHFTPPPGVDVVKPPTY